MLLWLVWHHFFSITSTTPKKWEYSVWHHDVAQGALNWQDMTPTAEATMALVLTHHSCLFVSLFPSPGDDVTTGSLVHLSSHSSPHNLAHSVVSALFLKWSNSLFNIHLQWFCWMDATEGILCPLPHGSTAAANGVLASHYGCQLNKVCVLPKQCKSDWFTL